MKKILKFSLAVLLMGSFWSCSKTENYNDVVQQDGVKPEVVTNVKVQNFSGGANITYTLPASGSALYVQADYKINDKTSRQTKSSYYSDTITVRGFAKSQDYEVTLRTVSRGNVMSDPIVVKVHPDTPAYLLVRPTLKFAPDFGGVNISARNQKQQAVGIIFLALDPVTGRLEVQDQNYTLLDSINYSLRGYNAVPRQVGAYVTDEFGNISDTLIQTITPLFETLLDRSKFFTYRLNSDSPIGYGWELTNLWDGKTDNNSAGWHTNPGGIQPMACTFGLGVTAKLSRFIIWERGNEFSYGHGNPKNFAIWGSNKTSPADAALPKTAPVGTVIGDWVNMANYKYPDPPSGLPPTAVNDADKAFVAAGVNFNFPSNSPSTRFIRVVIADTWGGGDFAHIMEMAFYGTP